MSSPISVPLGVVLVGAGHWGPNLVRNCNGSAGWTVRGVCDRDIDRARALADRYPAVRASDSLSTALEDPAVDAVAIATPAASHEPLALTAMEAGKHVPVEKPLVPHDRERAANGAHRRGAGRGPMTRPRSSTSSTLWPGAQAPETMGAASNGESAYRKSNPGDTELL